MKYSRSLLVTAEKDLKSVLVLYNAGFYSNAIFQMQQAVEKIVKSFGLEKGIINEEELKRHISHLPHKVITKMLEGQIKECDSYKKLITSFMIPEHEKIEKQKKKEAIIALNDVINYVRRENVNNIYFSNDDYENLISQASDLEKEGIYNDSEISASIIDRYQKINDHFRTIFFNDSTILELLDPLADMQNSNIEQKVLAYKENIERHRKFDYITFVWSNLSIMTAPHEQMSRYPSEKEPQKLDDLYNLELPIVKYTPQIVELLEKSIDIYKDIYKLSI